MPSFGQNLIAARAAATARINARIGEVRRAYITAIPGQEMLYQAKEAEARAYLAHDPAPPDLSDYPLLAAEVGITAETAIDLANLWLAMAAQWRAVAAQLETLRLGTIKTIGDATTLAAIASAEASFAAQVEGV